MKPLRTVAEIICLWLVITLALYAAALILAPADIASPQPIFRSTT